VAPDASNRASPLNAHGALRHIRCFENKREPAPLQAASSAKDNDMWILTEAPKGSNYYEADSTTGNKVLISDSCDMVIYARSQGADGFRLISQRGRESFFVGPAPVRGVSADTNGQLLEIAAQLNAVMLMR
jgi:hypothetical protein